MLLIIVAPTLLKKVNIKLEKKNRNSAGKNIEWFRENGMKANQDKSHFLSSLDISKQNFH